jgi:hypothetical protein
LFGSVTSGPVERHYIIVGVCGGVSLRVSQEIKKKEEEKGIKSQYSFQEYTHPLPMIYVIFTRPHLLKAPLHPNSSMGLGKPSLWGVGDIQDSNYSTTLTRKEDNSQTTGPLIHKLISVYAEDHSYSNFLGAI